MDYAITEDINKIIRIKNDLNEVLRENGIEGGPIFEDYPDKFRQVFRILEGYSEDVVDKNEYSEGIDTIVAEPEITWFENVVTITCATEGATIYYMVKSASGNNDRGYGPYEKQFYIKEDVYVEAYAQYNELKSSTAWANVPFYAGMTPNIPKIDRDDTTITITCEGTYTSIWWSTINGNYVEYTGPVTVARTKDVYAFSTYNRFASDIAFLKAPEQPVIPEIPVITPGTNSFTISCDTPGADIYYMRQDNFLWIKYDGIVNLEDKNQSGYYRAKSVLGNYESYPSEYVWIEYIVAPEIPDISCSNNVVTITCDTEGAEIYYALGGNTTEQPTEYIKYTGEFAISESRYIWAYAVKDGVGEDNKTYLYCEFHEPTFNKPAAPDIYCLNNVVIISSPDGGTIMYKEENDSDFVEYNEPFAITETGTYIAYVEKNGVKSDDTTKICSFVDPGGSGTTKPEAPDIDCVDNKVYITCLTEDVYIYYKLIDENDYHLYTGPISLTSPGTYTFMAYALKNQIQSDTTYKECVYTVPAVIPEKPSIICNNNFVIMTTETRGAAIWYRDANGYESFNIYTGPIEIEETTTFEAYSLLNGERSAVVSVRCVYESYIISNYQYEYCTLDIRQSGHIGFIVESMTKSEYLAQNWTIYYKINDGSWESVEPVSWVDYSHPDDRSYRKDKGWKDWEKINSIDVTAGDKVKIKSNISQWGSKKGMHLSGGCHISSNCDFNVYGNINSLVAGDNFLAYNSMKNELEFSSIFYGCEHLLSAENLVLPIRNITDFCYRTLFCYCLNLTKAPAKLPAARLATSCYLGMFYHCEKLENAPELPALDLITGCYNQMFYYCLRLNYIKCLAMSNIDPGSNYTSTNPTATTYQWVVSVQPGGTFVKNPVTPIPGEHGTFNKIWSIGVGGIPEGWTINDNQ